MLVPDLWGLLVVGVVCGSAWAAGRLLFRVPLKRAALEACFAAYLVGLLFVTVFAYWYPGRDAVTRTWQMVNLVPLRTIIGLARPEHVTQAIRQLAGNIVLFVPLGVLLPMLMVRCRTLGCLVLTAAAASVSIESVQLVLRLTGVMDRSVDVDDVILNTLGALIGWALWRRASSIARPTTPASR